MATSQGVHVIVGGLGGMGRCLQQQLLAHGKQVRVLDLAPSAQAAASRLVHPTSIEYAHCDLSSSNSTDMLHDALKNAETVYSLVTPDVLNGSAAAMRRTNVEGVQTLITACQTVGVPKLVYASSMAVTNQLFDHKEENEQVPLPDWDTYQLAYDRTKRQGEELVLQANNSNSNLQTCALRLGSVMAGQGDYTTRHILERPGQVISIPFPRLIDTVSARDLAVAFRLASDKMDVTDSPVGGKALFTTKSKNDQAATVPGTIELFAQEFGWKLVKLPTSVVMAMAHGYRAKETVKGLFRAPDEESTPGMPFDLTMEACTKEMTFDNSLAKELLGYEPQETWEDAVIRIAKECREAYPDLFSS
ncbi:3beta-hydroxysteroid-dehydrogenase/decarboxylase isoform [Seminavis robusta]|uniref:3beta-hydroxysteroid-dehydrogenase/decarboxylase isoform n=1 Tax=Seminavis robusta TaxID=568900 RepID=A0A9N8EUK4_9STRA|nr:3beta-hydroxysteroid-dehydrogenase/decarboxylase isoform [Seminavis robusta]|eukprot:Sro1805_g298740.1 3beta-hydroxysteroid-dehydrogenase/decarboxylase isoform (361) ;mRNA; r:2139-3221